MKVAKEFLSGEYNPTIGHKFIKKLEDEGILEKNLTQNIDDLESKAGISATKLLQAHGHARSAHCIACE
jgi:NAD-dependent SIR2 family protein deacetylase